MGVPRQACLSSQALALLVEALATCRRVLGARHPVTLLAATNLATTYTRKGKKKDAEGAAVQLL